MSKALSGKGGKQAYFTIQSDQVVKIKLRPIQVGRQTEKVSIAPTSIFYETTLRVGDVLLSINGMTYGSFDEGMQWLKTTPGTLTLKVINQAEL